jgi:hypothetical protein
MLTHCEARKAGCRAVSILVILAIQARPLPAAAGPDDAKDASDALFYEGVAQLAAGKIPEACATLERSVALLRRGGALLNLALCREKAGDLVAAHALFVEALDVATQDGHPDRAETARRHLDDLRAGLAWIAIIPSPALEIPGLEITCDGAALASKRWSSPIAVSPGAHVVIAAAPARETFEAHVMIPRAGETSSVQIPLLAELPAPLPAPAPAPTPTLAVEPPPPPNEAPGHGRHVGAMVRVDIDPIHPGAVVAVGATYGLFDYMELGASALLGREPGMEPRLTVYFLGRSAVKPLVDVGIPIFFSSGAHAGVRGQAGAQWDFSRHFGVFGQVGGAYFPGAEPGRVRGVFLPSLGVQGRI